MNNRNYQRELDALITGFEKENKVPRLFLHSCCAPCSSYVLEYLSKYFEITVFFIIQIFLQRRSTKKGGGDPPHDRRNEFYSSGKAG